MTRSFDMVVIGATVGGFAAAGFAARQGRSVLLLEQALAAPEPAGALFALDPEMLAALKLSRHGLGFTQHDLMLSAWDDEAAPPPLPRDGRGMLDALSPADAQGWGAFQEDVWGLARALRRWWWCPHENGTPGDMIWGREARACFERLCVTGAEDWLARYFQSPRLIGALLHDAVSGGFAPSEPGSALALVWRASQEMAGLQAAHALAAPRTLVAALRAACGAPIRMGVRVAAITATDDGLALDLSDGETVMARAVLSSLGKAASESLAGLAPDYCDGGVGETQIVFTVSDDRVLPAGMQRGRVVITAGPDAYADAHEAARAGRLAPALPLACVRDAPGRLVVTLPLTPAAPVTGWNGLRAPLAAQVVKTINRHMPGFAGALTGVTVTPPARRPRADRARLLAPAAQLAATRVPGLLLCGEDAEPVPCISGRAGRFAAYLAGKRLSAGE